jgi:ADP-ribosyl-[dinitrogen reductase] hydrolase
MSRRSWIVPRPESDKALGSLVGLAVCEALAKSSPASVSENAPLIPGLWGDGTSMALSLAESLIEIGAVDQRDQMVRYTSWYRYGYLSSTETCDFIDETVKQAILRFERTWNPQDESHTQGDACLARVAPVVMYFSDSREAMLDACVKSTTTTHSSLQSMDACRLLAVMIFEALRSTEKSRILRPQLPNDLSPEIADLCSDVPCPAKSQAAASLQAAMSAFRDSESFAAGSLKCLPHGPRALAAYGQLAGAWYGRDQIPQVWRQSLARNNMLKQMGNQLIKI